MSSTHENPMKNPAMLAAVLATSLVTSLAAHAQSAPPPRVDPATLLNLDDARAQQVHAILKSSHDKRMAAMQSIQAETDAQLSTVLSADEMAKLKAAMPRPARGARAASATGSPQ